MIKEIFPNIRKISPVAQNILKKRYYMEGENKWDDIVNRVVENILPNGIQNEKNITRQMILNGYFIPNSPCLVNSGKKDAGLAACFVVDFPDTIEGIYKTKLDFALIARKGGGCGTALTKIRPEGSSVAGSTHGYAGGGIKFADTISHDADALTQAGFRAMAIMFTESIYHPDIIKFITAKHEEGKISNANISVVVDDKFMRAVENNEMFWTEFNGKKYAEYSARAIFDLIVDGMWRNGEPGILFKNRIDDSPYKYTGQEIFATNPCVIGNTLIQTVEGQIPIKDLVGKEIDVYCQIDENIIGISHAKNIIKTKKNAELVQIITTRGDLICTPDHLIYTKNRGYVQAKNILNTDTLCSLNQKMMNETYKGISLTGTNKYIKEHRFIASHYWDINDKVVHHKDGNTINNKLSNLEVLDKGYHSSISNLGHENWCEQDMETGRFLPKEKRKKKKSIKLDYYPVGTNLRVLTVRYLPYREDVYDMEVETYHNFFANNVVVHNCSEQPLPTNGVCNLGSLDLSKFITKDKKIDWELLAIAIRHGVKFLDSVIDASAFPTKDIEKWAKENRAIGLGIMGYADLCLMKEIAYGSHEALQLLEEILSFIYGVAEDESINLGNIYGVPEMCKKLPVPRRNITLTTIAPTGTVSLIAGCVIGDTEIHTINGKKKIKDIVGTEQLVYASGEKEILVRKATDIRKTREKAEVWKIKFDTDDELILTPDHKVMLSNGDWKRTDELQFGDSVRIFSKSMWTNQKTNQTSTALYMTNLPRKFNHRVIAEYKYNRKIRKDEVVHHIDFNHTNDDIDNLEIIKSKTHREIHSTYLSNWSKNNIGKTYEEIFGKERAKELKDIKAQKMLGDKNHRYGHKLSSEEKNIVSIKTKEAMWKPEIREKYLQGMKKRNHKVIRVSFYGYEDVYNMEVEDAKNYVANGVVVHNCSSGIEPIFSEITVRTDKTGSYTFENNLADKPYFRCAVSSNGAQEVSWEEHIMTLATAQKHIDSGVSKTINFPTHTHRETIGRAVIMAWKEGCKGLAVYRNSSRKQEVLTPKNIKKERCPICGNDLITLDGKMRCLTCNKDTITSNTTTYYD